MYSAQKLSKYDDNIQPWRIPFPILNQFVPCLVLTVASWPAYRFLRLQVSWSGIPISLRIFQFVVIHTIKGFSIVKEAEIYVFLEFSCFLYDPTDFGNLISGSYAFSKSSLNIWKFLVHILLKPSLENFEQHFASMWNECNCVVVWAFFDITLLWDWTFLIAQLKKNPPEMQETPVQFLGQENMLEKGSPTHSSILGLPLWLSW